MIQEVLLDRERGLVARLCSLKPIGWNWYLGRVDSRGRIVQWLEEEGFALRRAEALRAARRAARAYKAR